MNIEYEQKRRSGRLHAPHVQVMSRGWSAKRLGDKIGRAARDTQFKDVLLGLPDGGDLPSEIIRDLST